MAPRAWEPAAEQMLAQAPAAPLQSRAEALRQLQAVGDLFQAFRAT